jgi:radical SAM superfamily enzyme
MMIRVDATFFRDFQNKKGAILEGTVKYLKHLLEQEKEMKRLLEVEEQLTAQNRQLHLTINVSKYYLLYYNHTDRYVCTVCTLERVKTAHNML